MLNGQGEWIWDRVESSCEGRKRIRSEQNRTILESESRAPRHYVSLIRFNRLREPLPKANKISDYPLICLDVLGLFLSAVVGFFVWQLVFCSGNWTITLEQPLKQVAPESTGKFSAVPGSPALTTVVFYGSNENNLKYISTLHIVNICTAIKSNDFFEFKNNIMI